MHMKHVRHTQYSVELLPENMPTKESRISVQKTNACGMYIHDYVTGIITCIDICHIHIVIKISPYVCNNNNFILSPSILTCLFCINHAHTRILSSSLNLCTYTQQLYIPPISGSRLMRLKAPFLHIIYGCPQ